MLSQAFGTFEATRRVMADLCRRYDRPRVLDVGCGGGELLVALADEIRGGIGIDISQPAIDAARARAGGVERLAFHAVAASRLKARNLGTFEVICFVGSLEHIPDPRHALEAALALMSPDGRVVVVAISPNAPHAVASRHALRWSNSPPTHLGVDGLRPIAEGAGLRVTDIFPLRRGTSGTPPLMGRLLSIYDAIGGPTHAVVLRPAAHRQPAPRGRDFAFPPPPPIVAPMSGRTRSIAGFGTAAGLGRLIGLLLLSRL